MVLESWIWSEGMSVEEWDRYSNLVLQTWCVRLWGPILCFLLFAPSKWIAWNFFLWIFFSICENLVVNWVIVFLFHDIWWDWQHLLVDVSKWTAFMVCVCRRLHIDSNFIFGNTIGTIGWSTFFPVLCPKILLHHHQCHRQPPHLFCLQYLWNLKVPPEQELESEGKGSMQINATWLGFFYSAAISSLSTWNGFQRDILKSALKDASSLLLL